MTTYVASVPDLWLASVVALTLPVAVAFVRVLELCRTRNAAVPITGTLLVVAVLPAAFYWLLWGAQSSSDFFESVSVERAASRGFRARALAQKTRLGRCVSANVRRVELASGDDWRHL